MKAERKIKLGNKDVGYSFLRRRGNKNLRISVHADGRLVVSAPKWCGIRVAEKFIFQKKNWILENLEKVEPFDQEKEERDYKKYKNLAREIVEKKITIFNKHYGFSIGKIYIRNQKSCWGSCSAKKNLNFSYKIIKLPDYLSDYVIVHELCHLKELNHSWKFWKLVSATVPGYKEYRKELRNINLK